MAIKTAESNWFKHESQHFQIVYISLGSGHALGAEQILQLVQWSWNLLQFCAGCIFGDDLIT